MPCCPAFIGPFPFALSAISLRALASRKTRVSIGEKRVAWGYGTSLLFGLECQFILVHIFLLLLGCLQRLHFAAWFRMSANGGGARGEWHRPSRLAPPILRVSNEDFVEVLRCEEVEWN